MLSQSSILNQQVRRIVSPQLSLSIIFDRIPHDKHNAEIWFWDQSSNRDMVLAFEYSGFDSNVTTNLELFERINLCETKKWLFHKNNLKLFLYNDTIDDEILKDVDFEITDDEKYGINEDDECWSIIKAKRLIEQFHKYFRYYLHDNYIQYSETVCQTLEKFMTVGTNVSVEISNYFDYCLDEEDEQELDELLLKCFVKSSEFEDKSRKSKEIMCMYFAYICIYSHIFVYICILI